MSYIYIWMNWIFLSLILLWRIDSFWKVCREVFFGLFSLTYSEKMQSQHYYFNVVRLNNQHTTVAPDDTFNFDIKVLYHTVHRIPHGLRNQFSPLSISCLEFFEEGQNFLWSLLSGLSFSIESVAEISEKDCFYRSRIVWR